MNQYYKNNQGYLLESKPNKVFSISVITFILMLVFTIFSFIYTTKEYYGANVLVLCDKGICKYYLDVPVDDTNKINNSKKIIIDKVNYTYKVSNIGQLKVDINNNISYQTIELKMNIKSKYHKNNLYLKAKIKIKEEKLYKKIWKIIFEKE